jgi:uncharacterized glyoxalase superfamily protein PhnB
MSYDDAREIVPIAPEMFVPDVAAAVSFYTEKLGFDLYRMEQGDGHALFAIISLGRAVVMFADETLYIAMGGIVSAQRGAAIDIRVMVEDVDAVYRRCGENGVTVVHDIADRYYGLRDFVIADLNGFRLRFASTLR